MKAIVYHRYGTADVLNLAEVEKPAVGDSGVLIRIHAASVTTADVAARQGSPLMARMAFGLFRPKLSILGTEFAGVVEACGQDVTRFKPGDEVYAATGASFGAHAEYICLPQDGALALKPASASFEESAALCEGTLTALPFLRDLAQLQAGQSVLINGASGSVGTTAVQLAKLFGAGITGVCSTRNLELVKSLGADRAIDYTAEDFTQSGRTYDVIFDAVGKSSFSRCKRSLKPRGIYLSTVPSLAIMLQMLWTARFGGKKAMISFAGLRPERDKAGDLVALAELVEDGKIKAVIDRCYQLQEAAEAHRYVERGHKTGHVVITMQAGGR